MKKCSRCKQSIESYGITENTDDFEAVITALTTRQGTYNPRKIYDLCPVCVDKFKQWLNGDDNV